MNMTGRAREKRPYRKAGRADAEAATHAAILDAAFEALSSDPFDRVTLNQIAERSGVTVQTIIRRFGSKEELFEELAQREAAGSSPNAMWLRVRVFRSRSSRCWVTTSATATRLRASWRRSICSSPYGL